MMLTRQNMSPISAQVWLIRLLITLALRASPDKSSATPEVPSDPTTELTVNQAIAINGSERTRLKRILESRITSFERFQ
jgi:hypothetical protein